MDMDCNSNDSKPMNMLEIAMIIAEESEIE